MPVLGAKYPQGVVHAGKLGVEFVEPEGGQGRGSAQLQNVRQGHASVKRNYTRPQEASSPISTRLCNEIRSALRAAGGRADDRRPSAAGQVEPRDRGGASVPDIAGVTR